MLAVSIYDTKKNEPGLELSVKESSFNKWYPVGIISVKNDGKIELDKNDDLKIAETKKILQSARFRKGRIYLIQMDVFLNYLRSHHQ